MDKIQFKRGLEANRKNITPAEGELIYTTDTKCIYMGDGSTPGGVLAIPIKFLEWHVSSVSEQNEYVLDEPFPQSGTSGFFMVFYGPSRLVSEDYSFDFENHKLVLENDVTSDDVDIAVYYMGL